RKFADNFNSLKEQGLGLLKTLPIDEKTEGQLANTLKELKANVRGGSGGRSGAEPQVDISFKVPGEAGDALAGVLRGGALGNFEKFIWVFPKGKGTAGKETTMLKKFSPADKTISLDLKPDEGGWRIESKEKEKRTIRLFELTDPRVEDCTVSYRARLKTDKLEGKAYLEMWCRVKGKEYFSRGLHNTASGTTDWSSYETPFFLKKGERPDLIRVNLVIEGKGTVWIKDVEVLRLAPANAGKEVPPGRVKAFGPKDRPLTQDRILADEGGWRIDARAKETRTIRLFEVSDPGVENCIV